MRKILFAALLVICLVSCAFAENNDPAVRWLYSFTATQDATQAVVISGCQESEGRGASFAFYERDSEGWHEILKSHAFIGKNGWTERKKEGDGKTPCGVYTFTKAFGINRDPGCPMGYTRIEEAHYWDGDSDSLLYNQFVSSEEYTDFDKAKSEHLIDYNMAYKYALAISYNPLGKPERGSAIFLHCYTTRKFTGGCVSIPESVLFELMKRVEEGCVVIMDEEPNITKY